jgi:hypothetical protein
LAGQVRQFTKKHERPGKTQVSDSPLSLASRGADNDRQRDLGSGMLARSLPRRVLNGLRQRDFSISRLHSWRSPHLDRSRLDLRVAQVACAGSFRHRTVSTICRPLSEPGCPPRSSLHILWRAGRVVL